MQLDIAEMTIGWKNTKLSPNRTNQTKQTV